MGLNFDIFIVSRMGTLLLCFIFSIAGTSVDLMVNKSQHGDMKLYFTEFKIAEQSFDYSVVDCSELESRIKAGLAFAIIGILTITGTLGCVVLLFVNAIPSLPTSLIRIVSVATSAVAALSIMISWAILVGTFHSEICGSGASAAESDDASLGAGTALLITTWIVLLIDLGLGVMGILKGRETDAEAAKAMPMLGHGLRDNDGSSNQPVLLI